MWALYGTPYFPIQVGLSLFVGWVLGGTLQHRCMFWVWVFPLGALISAFVGLPLTGHLAVEQYTTLRFGSRLTYFFGLDSHLVTQLDDQVVATLPFYSAVAYSLGAFLAFRVVRLPVFFETMRSLRKKRLALLVGLPWFCLKLALSWQQAAAQFVALRTWPGLRMYLQGLLVASVFLTLVSAIAVALVGRQFFLTRFFLNASEPSKDRVTMAQPQALPD